MAFQPFVALPHYDWTIQQTWNEQTTQFDRVAVKGSRRVEQGSMTYSALLRLLDGIDGRKATPGGCRPLPATPAALPDPSTPDSTPAAPSHPSLFGESL